MPKVTGPCFSLSAVKTLKKLLTFQRKKGLNLVTKYKKPGSREPFTPSPKQQEQRAEIGGLVAQWQSLGSIAKGVWDNYAGIIKYVGTGYHYFISKGGIMPSLTDVRIFFGDFIARVTPEGWLETKSHSSDYCFGEDFAAAQEDQVIITPTAGKKIKVVQVYVSTKDEVTDVTLKFADSGNIFFKLYTAKKQAQAGNVICGEGAVAEAIELTCGAGTFVSISYDEVE